MADYKCTNCGRLLDAQDLKEMRDYMGEFWGTPAYETFNVCPYCGSEELDKYYGDYDDEED